MKNLLTFLAFTLLLCCTAFAQDSICGTPDYTESSANLRSTASTQQMTVGSMVCIDVHFHIVRETNGTGGFNENDLPSVINRLNNSYNKFGIFINYAGFDYIDNSTYYDFDNTEFSSLVQEKKIENAINFYIVGTFPDFFGRAGRPSNYLVVRNDAVMSTTSSHELGHCLGLAHTHENSHPLSQNRENVARSGPNKNCGTAGDTFCDTPADPNLADSVNYQCQYIGNALDNNYVPFDPDVTNIMSYALEHCKNSFSNEQGAAMLLNIHTIPAIQATISATCTLPSISGNPTICNNDVQTYNFDYPSNPSSIFVSNNLEQVSSNTNSITIQRKSGETGTGVVTARINGFDVERNVQLHITPSISNYSILGVPSQASFYGYTQASVTESNGATQYEWTIVDDFNSCNGSYHGPVFSEITNSTQVITYSRFVGIHFGSCAGTFRIRCRAISSCGYKSYSDWVVSVGNSPCTGSLSIYPNPSSSIVTLRKEAPPGPCLLQEEENKSVSYQLYDDKGNLIWKKNNGKKTQRLDMRSYKKGVYYIHATSGTNQLVKQLIKK